MGSVFDLPNRAFDVLATATSAFTRRTHRTFPELDSAPVRVTRNLRKLWLRNERTTTWSAPAHQNRSFIGLKLRNDHEPKEVTLAEWKGQRFAAYATEWEKKHCLPIGKVKGFTPVVDANGTLEGWLLSGPAKDFRVRLTGSWLEEREYSVASFRRGEQARHPGDTFVAWITWLGWPPPGPRRQKLIEVGFWKKFDGIDDYWKEVPGWVDAAPFESGLSIFFDPNGNEDSTQYLRFHEEYTFGLLVVCDIDGQVQLILDTYPTSQGTAVAPAVDPMVLLGAGGLAKSLFGLLRSRLARSGFTTLFVNRLRNTLAKWRGKGARRPHWEVLREGPHIPGSSIPEWLEMRVGNQVYRIQRNAEKLAKDGKPIGPATKHLAEKGNVQEADRWNTGAWAKRSQVDFPMSTLAADLEEAQRLLVNGTVRSGQIFRVGAWEFGINTTQNPWVVYHAVYNPKFLKK